MFYYELQPGQELFLPGLGCEISARPLVKDEMELQHNLLTAYIDYDKVKNGLAVRNRRPGDRLVPLGMKGTKKLKKLLIDEKIPREERDSIPIVVDGDELVWVAGVRLSERYKVDSFTENVLQLICSLSSKFDTA